MANDIRNAILYESITKAESVFSNLDNSTQKSVISEISEKDDITLLGFLAIKQENEFIKACLKNIKLDENESNAMEEAVEEAIISGNEKLLKFLLTKFNEVFQSLDEEQKGQVESKLMVAACNKSKSSQGAIIQLLYENGFRVRKVLEVDEAFRNTEYHYKVFSGIKAQCCPYYRIGKQKIKKCRIFFKNIVF